MNPQERLIRRLNDEMSLAEKIFRVALRIVIAVLAVAVVAFGLVLLVEALFLGVTIPPIIFGIFWWLVGFLIVSIVVWAVAAR